MRDRVFFSYSHKDGKWLQQFQTMLHPALAVLILWDDTKIQPGQKWREEIAAALESTKVAVLLVSADFLASNFIQSEELPKLLKAAGGDELTIFWVYLSACLYKRTAIADYQAASTTDKPLDMLSGPRRKLVISEICEKIVAAAKGDGKLGEDLFRATEPEAVALDVASPP